MVVRDDFDFLVIGSGPGGQKAAICAAKEGCRVALVERDAHLGGSCVHHGTIPSKTLREMAMRRPLGGTFGDKEFAELTARSAKIVASYANTVEAQIERNGVARLHGHACFLSPDTVSVRSPGGEQRIVRARHIVLAGGSRPREPEGIPVDHEHLLDADSILSLAYLPGSMLVLGGGVIACEYASIFAELGVEITIIDRGDRPLAFLDDELVEHFLADLAARGGRYFGGREIERVAFDGVSQVVAELRDGEVYRADKVFVALGRTPSLEGLGIERAGLCPGARGQIVVDEGGRSDVAHIFVVGDLAGPPALATSAMEQGRLAVRHALGLGAGRLGGLLPIGIYSLPEMASVGSGTAGSDPGPGEPLVGRAHFSEIARAQISGHPSGLLKLVAECESERLIAAHVVGEGATELIHIAQMAILGGATLSDLVESVFNFPTLAEAYRVAALDGLRAREKRSG